jgi:hypothetical protein
MEINAHFIPMFTAQSDGLLVWRFPVARLNIIQRLHSVQRGQNLVELDIVQFNLDQLLSNIEQNIDADQSLQTSLIDRMHFVGNDVFIRGQLQFWFTRDNTSIDIVVENSKWLIDNIQALKKSISDAITHLENQNYTLLH